MSHRVHLLEFSEPELVSFVETLGEPSYRGRQIFGALQHRRMQSFEEMTDLPRSLRAKLTEQAAAATMTLESRHLSTDGTRRYLMKTHDNFPVETVFIPEERRD
ncbi:MAG TPA: hypothetical protein VGN86_07420, partial [Pyrinomonadaceae bacterium]|nr:hypothetical protein [Pyrinomonadaceae bacterium]